MFTDQESEDLEDVKLDIRRRYDIKASKNDIARVSVAEVLADYKKRGKQSTLLVALRNRAQRQH